LIFPDCRSTLPHLGHVTKAGAYSMDWKHLYLGLHGRIGRQSFWIGLLVMLVVSWVIFFIDMNFFPTVIELDPATGLGYGPLTLLTMLATIYPAIALYAKRWHDRNKSGWWSLIILVPFVGVIWFLVELGFLRGTAGANHYGPDPLG
jgi:uncharacterized membrane protein YhaH (DUF805 family)